MVADIARTTTLRLCSGRCHHFFFFLFFLFFLFSLFFLFFLFFFFLFFQVIYLTYSFSFLLQLSLISWISSTLYFANVARRQSSCSERCYFLYCYLVSWFFLREKVDGVLQNKMLRRIFRTSPYPEPVESSSQLSMLLLICTNLMR
jgi:hypothetical protein